MTITASWLAHRVQRYHTNPHLASIGQLNSDHCHGVASIIAILYPEASADLLKAAIFHDAGERAAGDLSTTFKRANPFIAAAHAEYEDEERAKIAPQYDLEDFEQDWLTMADHLEAILFCAFHRPGLLDRPDWSSHVRRTLDRAQRLGVGLPVEAAIDAMAQEGWA
jgi:hypothetical protein